LPCLAFEVLNCRFQLFLAGLIDSDAPARLDHPVRSDGGRLAYKPDAKIDWEWRGEAMAGRRSPTPDFMVPWKSSAGGIMPSMPSAMSNWKDMEGSLDGK